MNRSADISTALRNAGITVYSPAGHRGVCTAPYAVVQGYGSYLRSESARGGVCRYRVHVLVPTDMPAQLEPFALSVQKALKPLEQKGVIRMSAPRSPAAVNDRFAAIGCFLEYISEYSL